MENKNANRFLEVTPGKILLQKTSEGGSSEAGLNLKNITNECVVFKVFINRSAVYSSVPPIGYINPGESVNIKIKKFEKVRCIYYYNH